MAENANTVWADGPAGSPHMPSKAAIRAWGTWLESFVTAIGTNTGTIFQTRASLFSSLAYPANTLAWVMSDPTVAYNGLYQKSGVSGSGSWSRIGDLPYSFITAVDDGSGTPNAIAAATSTPISSSALVIMNVFEANTGSPVTVAFNGGAALTIKTNTGNDVAAGGLVAGMRLLGVVSGSNFRLVSDQVSTAVVAAAEAFANSAAGSATAAGTSATNAGASAALAQKWASEAEDVPVSGGLFSAFHWAQKAASVVIGGIAAAVHAATAKVALDDTDEIGIADSTASWGLKKVTLANLIASIFNGNRKIANAQFAAPSFGLINAGGKKLSFDTVGLAADVAINPEKMGIKALASGAIPTTAAVDWAIPADARRITLILRGFSTSGGSPYLVQLKSGGIAETTGYEGDAVRINNSVDPNSISASAGLTMLHSNAATAVFNTKITLIRQSGNVWSCEANGALSNTLMHSLSYATKAMAGVLDGIRLTTVNGTDVPDAGTYDLFVEY